MKILSFLVCVTLCFAASPRVFRGTFLQEDEYGFSDDYANKEGPLVDPPAGHGLPEFSAPPYELTPDQLIAEYDAWKLLEAEAEQEFYDQTDAAIAEAEAKLAACSTDYTTEEDIADCEAKAQMEIEMVNESVESLQTSHGTEEELFEAALEFLINEYMAENPDYVSGVSADDVNPNS